MTQIKKLDRYMEAADKLLFGRMEELQITGVERNEALKFRYFPQNPHLISMQLLTTGKIPEEVLREISIVNVTAQNSDGEVFRREYCFRNSGRAASFERTMRDYQRQGSTLNAHIISRRNKLPWYLPHIV